jgi:hypothetical protein
MAKHMLASLTVRQDYMRYDGWTYAEAGAYADGRRADTMSRWAKRPVLVRVAGHTVKHYRFGEARKKGACRVDAASFIAYMRTGEPQGQRT